MPASPPPAARRSRQPALPRPVRDLPVNPAKPGPEPQTITVFYAVDVAGKVLLASLEQRDVQSFAYHWNRLSHVWETRLHVESRRFVEIVATPVVQNGKAVTQ